MDVDIKLVRELMQALKRFDMAEIDVRKGTERIRIKRVPGGGGGVAVVGAPIMPALGNTPSMPPPVPMPSADASAAPEEGTDAAYITSPFVGTFYRAPSPEAPPFVEVGSTVQLGQVICIIEAMKLMNEIESELHCRVLDVLVQDAQPVEYGQRLFKVQKLA